MIASRVCWSAEPPASAETASAQVFGVVSHGRAMTRPSPASTSTPTPPIAAHLRAAGGIDHRAPEAWALRPARPSSGGTPLVVRFGQGPQRRAPRRPPRGPPRGSCGGAGERGRRRRLDRVGPPAAVPVAQRLRRLRILVPPRRDPPRVLLRHAVPPHAAWLGGSLSARPRDPAPPRSLARRLPAAGRPGPRWAGPHPLGSVGRGRAAMSGRMRQDAARDPGLPGATTRGRVSRRMRARPLCAARSLPPSPSAWPPPSRAWPRSRRRPSARRPSRSPAPPTSATPAADRPAVVQRHPHPRPLPGAARRPATPSP